MREVVPKRTIRNAKYLLDERGPLLIAIPRASDDAGNHPSNSRLDQIIAAVSPASQRMPQFDGCQRFVPLPFEKVAKDLRDCTGSER
jgi:hypothetical protein